MADKMRRLDDLKLQVHDLTEMIESMEKNPDARCNRILIEICRLKREEVKREIHDREMKAREAA
jgi:hypothetical protein